VKAKEMVNKIMEVLNDWKLDSAIERIKLSRKKGAD
jgi:hypothetical protein